MEGFCLVCNVYWKQIVKLNVAVFESEKLRCITCISKLLFLPQKPFQNLLSKSVICEDCVHKVLETEKMMTEMELLQGRIVQTRRDVESILIRSHNQVVGPADKVAMENHDNINTKTTRRQIIELLRLKTDEIPASSPFGMLATLLMEQQNPATPTDLPSSSMPVIAYKRKPGRPYGSVTAGKYKGIKSKTKPVPGARKRKLLDTHVTYNDDVDYLPHININGSHQSNIQDMDESMKLECFKNLPMVSLLRLSPMSSSIKLSEDVTINEFIKKESLLINKRKRAFTAANKKGRKRKLVTPRSRAIGKQKARAIGPASKGKRKIKLTEKAKLNSKLPINEEENDNEDEYFVEPEELKKMVQKARKITKGAKPGDFMCGICSLSYESMDILNMHMNIHIGPSKTEAATTNSISQPGSEIGYIKCQECSKKFNSEKSLSEHERAMHRKKCNQCDLEFSSEEAYTLHSVSHKPQPKRRQVSIECQKCDETFSTSYLLNLHTATNHSKRRTTYNSIDAKAPLAKTTASSPPLTATTIDSSSLNNGDSLATSSYEIVNENGNDDDGNSSDEDDQKFACEVCKKKFFSDLVLQLHSLKHRSCEICSIVFSTPEAFSAHRVSSHPDPSSKNPQNTHVCVLCEVSFTSKDILDKHQREAHTSTKEYDDSPPILDEIRVDSNKVNHNYDDDELNNSSSPPKLEEFGTPSIKDLKDIFFKDLSEFT